MDQNRLTLLLKLYADNIATREEVEELFAMMKTGDSDLQLKKMVIESANAEEPAIDLSRENWDRVWNDIQLRALETTKKQAKTLSIFPWKYVAAAVLLLVGTIGIFFTRNKNKGIDGAMVNDTRKAIDIPPGGNKAILTLADGSSVVLDSVQNGYLTSQNNTKIIKLSTGLLSYKGANKQEGKVLYNTITTPRGGQYQVELPDGTTVWLNAASSLTFPTAFVGKERRVDLKGEAYFEVAKDHKRPFHVTANNTDVQVLGTHFNIMSYPDEESINTTLLEGSIKLTANGITKQLRPGIQAIVNKQTNVIEENRPNIKQVMAWKNGEFRFRNTEIKELMRQVGRWYDVDIEYQTKSTNQYFTASLPRMQNISALLQVLELTGTVHFKIDNKKIIVLP